MMPQRVLGRSVCGVSVTISIPTPQAEFRQLKLFPKGGNNEHLFFLKKKKKKLVKNIKCSKSVFKKIDF